MAHLHGISGLAAGVPTSIHKGTLALLALVPVLLSSAAVGGEDPDLIVLKDGRRVPCRVLLESDTQVVYRVKNKTEEALPADVAEVHSIERSLRSYLERFAAVDRTDAAALHELGQFAKDNALPGEARNTWIRILTLDPANEQAWTELGGQKRKDVWEFKVGGRFYTLDELRTRRSDWKNALELSTAHFLVKTDAAPEPALDVAVDLERAWVTFYDLLGEPLDLYVFDEVPEVHLYADPKDCPAPPVPGQDAWFAPGENTLYVNARPDRDRGTIVAEFSECLVFNAFRRTLGKTGQIEPWARKALSFAFAAAARPAAGSVSFDFKAPYAPWFQAHAADPEPLSLSKILSAGAGSFDGGGTHVARYQAEAYTLLYFLCFYEDGKYRPGLAEFLKRSYLGKGGASNFFEALGADEKTLEKEWVAYVKEIGG